MVKTDRTQGSVIVYVLLMVAIISVVVFVSLRSAKSSYLESRFMAERFRTALALKPLAFMGVERYMSEMTVAQLRRYSKFNKMRMEYKLEAGGRTYRVVVEPEVGRISVNLADRATLERLFKKVLNEADYSFKKEEVNLLVDSLMDFRDKDNDVRPQGAERDYYIKSGYEPKNGFLTSLSELMWVRGVSEDIYRRLVKYLTILNVPINVNYTTKDILLLAGLSEAEANLIIGFQKAKGLRGLSKDELYGSLTPYHREIYAFRFVLHPMPNTFRVYIYEGGSKDYTAMLVIDVYGNIYDLIW